MFMYLHSMTTHLSALIALLNTNNSDNTNIFLHTDRTLYSFEHEIRRRPTDRREVITRITRIFFCTRRRGAQF